MKTLVCLTVAIGALASPVLTFAQSTSGPLTRAEVRADLVRLEKAGYDPSTGEDVNYPADIQAAEAKVAAEDAMQANNGTGGVPQGGSSGSAASGASMAPSH